jgi:endonuclease/exonuclease/phosphatase (EEP) superfamily protein YafD
MVLMALLPSWLGLSGGWHWLLDLCAHFRWQYLIVCATAILIAAWRRQRWVVVAAVLTFALNGLLIGRLAWQSGADRVVPAPGFRLQVVSLNVLRSNPSRRAVLEYLLASDADVLFLMEIDQPWLDALAPLAAKYPHHFAQPRPDNFGLALFSRTPMTGTRLLELAGATTPSVAARLSHQGRELVLIGTHPVPPIGGRATALRDVQLAALAAYVGQMNEPALVVGDLNATPWSRGMRLLTGHNLQIRGAAAAWAPTWRADSALAIPIDHALATAPLVITQREVGPDVGSDHRPVRVSVGWAG